MIVQKFGGTSVEDATAMIRVARIVESYGPTPRLVVASACSGVTNTLLEIGRLASERAPEKALTLVDELEKRHLQIADGLFGPAESSQVRSAVHSTADELRTLVRGLIIVGETSPRSLDLLASFGERLSTLLLHACIISIGTKAVLMDSRSLLITDNQFTRAKPNIELTEQRLKERVLPALMQGTVVVTQGFIGATSEGTTTTIGRGGSDYSAALFGGLLNAEEIQIWTDVDGILTADPSIVKEARRIRLMSFNEAAELAYFGARVLHPETIRPAVDRGIPVCVLNSRRPEIDGTRIINAKESPGARHVKSVAYKEGITLINMISTRMFLSHGFLEEVFDVFHRHRTVVHTVATSDVSISVTINDSQRLADIVAELDAFSTVSVVANRAIVCVVGDHLRRSRGIIARIFGALDEENINMISQGASEINLSFVIDENQIERVVQKLHDVLFRDVHSHPEVFA
jgi:aspartate kinase